MSLIELVAQAKKVHDLSGKTSNLLSELPEDEKSISEAILILKNKKKDEDKLLQSLIEILVLVCDIQKTRIIPSHFEAMLSEQMKNAREAFPSSIWPFRVVSLNIEAEYELFIIKVRTFITEFFQKEVPNSEFKKDMNALLKSKEDALARMEGELAVVNTQLMLLDSELHELRNAEEKMTSENAKLKIDLAAVCLKLKKAQDPLLSYCMMLELELEVKYQPFLDMQSEINEQLKLLVVSIYTKLKQCFFQILTGESKSLIDNDSLPVAELDKLLKINYQKNYNHLFRVGFFPDIAKLPKQQHQFYTLSKRIIEMIRSGKFNLLPRLDPDELQIYQQNLQNLLQLQGCVAVQIPQITLGAIERII